MQFSKEVIAILDYLCAKVGIVIDWFSETIAPYLRQLCERYINYEVVTSCAWCLMWVIFFGITYSIWKRIWAKSNDHCDEPAVFATIALAGVSFITILVVSKQVFDIITCATIPEKVILEYVKSLLRSAKNSMGG